MMGCSCSIDLEYYEKPSAQWVRTPMAKIKHTCAECARDILPGEQYERVEGIFDGSWDTFKTCVDCLSVRDALFCSWGYGAIWGDLLEEWREYPDLPSSECMMSLTKRGRDMVCDTLEEAWEDNDANQPKPTTPDTDGIRGGE